MKILHIISSFPPAYSYGGALNVAYNMSKELVNNGHDVTVYTTDAYDSNSRLKYVNNPEIMDGISVFHFRNISNKLSKMNFTCAPLIIFALRNNLKQFDIMHIHEYRSFQAIVAHHYAKKYNIPYIIQPHGSLPRIIEKQGLKRVYDIIWGNKILEDASKIVAVSNTETKQFQQVGIPDKKISMIPNGFNVMSYTDLPPKGQFREQYGIHEKHIILYVGRIHKLKGIDFLLRAFHLFSEAWEGNDVALIIVGPDEGYRSVLKDLVKQLNLSNKVRFMDYTSSVGVAYQDADVLVYPSVYEIFGLVPLEALLCGTPVIVTDDCGCGELIKEAECGYLVHYGDVTHLSETLQSALEHPDVNEKMVEAGRQYIKEHLAWGKIVKQVEAMYEEYVE